MELELEMNGISTTVMKNVTNYLRYLSLKNAIFTFLDEEVLLMEND